MRTSVIPTQGRVHNEGDARDLAVSGPAFLDAEGVVPPGASLLALLAALGLSGATGRLRIAQAGGRASDFSLLNGSVVRAERPGTTVDELHAAWLSEQRVVDRARIAQVRAADPETPLLQALYAAKACSASDLVNTLRNVREGLLREVLTPGPVAFSWDPAAEVRRPDPVGVDLLAFCAGGLRAATRSSYAQDLDPLLDPHLGRYVFPAARLTPALAEAVLTDKERKVLEVVVDGTATLREAVAMSLLTRVQTSRLFVLCTFLGLVEYRVQGLPKGGVAALEAELKSTLERMKDEDLFQRLGIHWTTHPKHYEPAYRKMADRWGPGSTVRRHSPLCEQRAGEIMVLVEEAFRVITNPRTRAVYRQERMGPDTIRFGTDFLFKQAHLAVFRDDWEQAREIIESAMDIQSRQEFSDFLTDVMSHRKPA